MNMPQATSTSLHDPSTPAVVRLVDTAGRDGSATASEVAGHLQTGGFFWLDLEDPGDDELAKFSQSLRLPADTIVSLVHASARSSFAPAADSVQAVLPAAVDTKPTAWLEANYVTVMLTERFLFTVHAAPCAPLHHARHQYHALDNEDARADRARVLFLILDVLIGSFRSQLLALDDRLDEIQLGMLRGASPKVHDELVQILGIITDGIQELGWYAHDLEEIAETVDRLPGMRPGAAAFRPAPPTRHPDNGEWQGHPRGSEGRSQPLLRNCRRPAGAGHQRTYHRGDGLSAVVVPHRLLRHELPHPHRRRANHALAIHPAGPAAADRQRRPVPAAHP